MLETVRPIYSIEKIMSKHVQQTIRAILEGNLDEAKITLNKRLEAGLTSLVEQAHTNYKLWVDDTKKRGAVDYRRPSRSSDHNIQAVNSEGKVVGTWQGHHGGYTHKADEDNEQHVESDVAEAVKV